MSRCTYLVSAIWWVSLCGTSAGATLTGVVYGDQGGPSAGGTGEIRLAVHGKVYSLDYQKPYPKMFSSQTCRSIGSIWMVEVKNLRGHEGTLIRAKCNGGRDAPSYAAIVLVNKYLNMLGSEQYEQAYSLFSLDLKNTLAFPAFVTEARRFDLSMYRTHGGDGGCLEIVERVSEVSVRVRAGLECYVEHSGHVSDALTFQVKRAEGSGRWEIVGLEITPTKKWTTEGGTPVNR